MLRIKDEEDFSHSHSCVEKKKANEQKKNFFSLCHFIQNTIRYSYSPPMDASIKLNYTAAIS